jgi:hypothetical protein
LDGAIPEAVRRRDEALGVLVTSHREADATERADQLWCNAARAVRRHWLAAHDEQADVVLGLARVWDEHAEDPFCDVVGTGEAAGVAGRVAKTRRAEDEALGSASGSAPAGVDQRSVSTSSTALPSVSAFTVRTAPSRSSITVW